jgi:multidrug efflux pump
MSADETSHGRFNVSAAALNHKQLTLFFILAMFIAGGFAYFKLGQREDPDFTFRAMLIRAAWPGATTSQMDQFVTDKIEKKLQELPNLKRTVTYSKPGEAQVMVELTDDVRKKDVSDLWYQVRKKMGDIRSTLPAEMIGPFYNDEFGDVFGSIWAFTGDGFNLTELREHVEAVRQELINVPDVNKVELVGVQEDKIFVELSNQKLGVLGIDPAAITTQLQGQIAVTPSGAFQTETTTIPLRVTGDFNTVEAVRKLDLNVGGKNITLGDIANVRRGYVDPPLTTMRFGGKPAIGLTVSMKKEGDVIQLGHNLDREMARIKAGLPVGIEFFQVSDQPKIVKDAVNTFMRSLVEAVVIVLIVSFVSLGLRAGLVVALTIPLVLCGTFWMMQVFKIDLHRISTGALIIALGLLVDDAMIAVEMMARKIEEGFDKFTAATFAYASTAWPMLTGTLITAAGFLPIATAKSGAGEYTVDIFNVTTIALLVSWVVAIVATPLFGFWILKPAKPGANADHHEIFDSKFYQALRGTIDWCIRHRWITIAFTIVGLILGVIGMGKTEKQFFPSSDRSEVMVEMWLPEGSSFRATEAQVEKLEKMLAADKDVQTYASYVGNSSPRYYLSLQQEILRPNFAHSVILTPDVGARDRVVERLRKAFETDFPGIRGRALRTPLGPPVNYPVQFRVSGPDLKVVKRLGDQVATIIRKNASTVDTNTDWGDQTLAIKITVDQDKARALGTSSQVISRTLQGALSGITLGQFREADRAIDIVLRAPDRERIAINHVRDLQVGTLSGKPVPLSQVATVTETLEEPIIRRYSRMPTLIARADVVDGVQAPDVSAAIDKQLVELRASLPVGYRIDLGGSAEESSKSQASLVVGVPMMLLIWFTLLMLQLQSFSLAAIALITAPFGIVGVALGLLAFRMPFGFVATLGVIALMGIIMRNTIILLDQIQQELKKGTPPWDAAREAAVRRFRPICLTAAAAVLAMVPLTRSVLWGPMAVAIMAGLVIATVLTILSVPAIYAACYRVKRPQLAEPVLAATV